jgi:hypothetical protein
MEMLSRFGALLTRVRTPLALAGLVVLVLYAIYRQILQMSVFSQVSSEQTFVLIDRIAFYLFCLAVLAIVLALIGYFRTARPRGKADDLRVR